MDISNKQKFRIKSKIEYINYNEEIVYTLQIYKKTFWGKRWKDYKIRILTSNLDSNKRKLVFKNIYFSNLSILKDFFKDYIEEPIIYKNYKIYAYCHTAYGVGWCVDYIVTNLEHIEFIKACDLQEMKLKIDRYENYYDLDR